MGGVLSLGPMGANKKGQGERRFKSPCVIKLSYSAYQIQSVFTWLTAGKLPPWLNHLDRLV